MLLALECDGPQHSKATKAPEIRKRDTRFDNMLTQS